ncbi:WD repeat-containing protein 43-like [Fagus crenata]|uniref:Small-subunit processome Utp12 domain-containing protein n=1 Tax=Fagus sylvatica TaxID=28930 RepID=A0A2N9GAP5_FAGSY
MPSMKKKKSRRESSDGVLVNEEEPTEPTMGEKLETLNLIDDAKQPELSLVAAPQPPSADSVQVLLRQALRADDRTLLLDCLYNRDEKVIVKSVSLLNPADVLKLLQSLISIIQSRGAILLCALPWLKSLLLQHASGIMSQESSLIALNSLYQLIESRVSTFESAIQLSSCLDILYTGVVDDDVDENATLVPVIYEDNDESDEEKSEDAMETDQDSSDEEASEASEWC